MNSNLKFIHLYQAPMFSIEQVSEIINIVPDTIRQWASRDKVKIVDAEMGVKGRRVLFSPQDLLMLLVASRLSHAQLVFRGESPIERKYLDEDGRPMKRRRLDAEIRGQIAGNIFTLIYDLAQIEDGSQIGTFNKNPENARYFVVSFEPDTGDIFFEKTGYPLGVDKGEGLIIVIDCFLLAQIAVEGFRRFE